MRWFQPNVRFVSFAADAEKVEGRIRACKRADIDVTLVRKRLRAGVAIVEIARECGVSARTLSRFIHSKGLSFMLRRNQPYADFSKGSA